MGKRLVGLSCCALLIGCGGAGPVAEEFNKVPNPFGAPFEDRQDVSRHVPIGTPVKQAQAEMATHGFDLWSCQRQEDESTLIFHLLDPAGFRSPSQDRWVTLYCQRGVVVNVEFQPGPPGSARAQGP